MAGAKGTDVQTKVEHVLTEARVVLPGVQALLGFQLAAVLTDAFEKLPRSSQLLHLASLGALALGAGAATAVLFVGAWYAVPSWARARRETASRSAFARAA